MWDFSLAIPSFGVLIVFLIYYIIRPSLRMRLNNIFIGILLIEITLTLVDYFACRALEKDWLSVLPHGLVYILNMSFFVLFVMRIFWFFMFTACAVKFRPAHNKLYSVLFILPFAIGVIIILSNFFSDVIFTIDASGESAFARGPLYDLIYVVAFFYILLSFVLTVKNKKKVTAREYTSVIAFNFVLLVGYLIRIFLPFHLVMPLFCLVSIIIIFLSFENPDFNMSDRGTIFNTKAFRESLEEITARKTYRVFGFVLRNYVDERGIYGGAQMDEGISLISEYLAKEFPQYNAFYLRSGRFALTGTGSMDRTALRETIFRRFQEPWKATDAYLYLNVAFVQIGWESQVRDPDKIYNDLLLAYDKALSTVLSVESYIDLDHDSEIDSQMDVKRALETAVEAKSVEVFYQPVIDAKDRKVIGAEALARIRNAEGKIIPPGLFIPIAEKNGYINDLGEQVLERTCAFIHDNKMESFGMSWINVNLSPIQCMRKDLCERFALILRKYGVDPEMIHLEITEQSMEDLAVLQKQIDDLRRNGFKFSLDDYGSGYSNLTRVKRYPFFNIKIDMEVVWDFFKDRDNLLPMIILAFRQMGFSITAEGIETSEMADLMTEIGCDYLQGYFFSKPLPPEEFIAKYKLS